MKVTEGLRAARGTGMRWLALVLLITAAILTRIVVHAQGISTTTVQGTVYLASGQAGAGTLSVRWPAFTTAGGQAVAAGSLTVKVAADGFLSMNLAPNQGSIPAGLYYTVVLYLSDGTTSTEYWVVPAAATATLGQVRAQVMPAAQAVQAVSKAYVDQSISQLAQSLLTASGGSVNGPLYLNGDPTQAQQAADKHYVDTQVATAVPLSGGSMVGMLTLNGDPTQDLQAADKRYVDNATSAAVSIATSKGTVNAGSTGQIAYYTGNGSSIGGTSAVPVTAGGTGASSAAAALQNLGALPTTGGTLSGPLNGTVANLSGQVQAGSEVTGTSPTYNVLYYGADKSGVADSTTAIQSAIAAAASAGGGTVYLPSGHYKHTGLTLPTGVRLIGDSMGFCPGCSAGHDGTVLTNTGTGPGITLTPDYGGITYNALTFEIAWMTINGSTTSGSGTDDGIDFLANTGTPSRMGWVHDVRVGDFGRYGFQIYGTSYNHFERVYFRGNCGNTAINIPGQTGTITEFSWFSHMVIGVCPVGIHVSNGDMLYFDHIDTGTGSGTNMLIDGGFGLYFANMSCTSPVSTCVEINAATSFVGRLKFSNLEIGMAGNSTAEKGVWIHRSASWTAFDVSFDHTDVYNMGATVPTNWIVDTGSTALPFGLSMTDTHVGIAGTTASLNQGVASYQTQMLNANFWDGNPNDADLNTIVSGGSAGLLAHSQSSGSNFYAHKLAFGATNCNGGPGWQFLGSTTAAARGSESLNNAFALCNNGSFNAYGQNHSFKYAADGALSVYMQAGATGLQSTGTFINSYTGSNIWYYGTNGVGYFGVQELPSTAFRILFVPSGSTSINSGTGANPVKINMSANSGTTGVVGGNGGSSPAQTWSIDGPGNATFAGVVTGGNDTTRTTSTTMTNAWTTTGLVLPTVPVNTTKTGHCTVYWQMSSTSYTATFGLGMNNAPTNVWGGTRVVYAATGTSNWQAFTQSSTATAAISAATTAGATGTTYVALMDFVIQTGASSSVATTLYGQTSNSGATLTIMPGSTCSWLP